MTYGGSYSKYLQFPPNQRRAIPFPKGPYTTGCTDLLIGRDLDGSLMRLFYPTDVYDIRAQPYEYWTRWYLDDQYMNGTSLYLFHTPIFTFGLNTFIRYFLVKIMKFVFGNVLIPAIWEAPISSDKNPIPVVIFSHGNVGNRNSYSSICNEIASYGFLVAVVEHRDETASATFTLTKSGKKKWTTHRIIYNKANVPVLQIRNKQLKIRARECIRVMNILHQLNQGIPLENLLNSSFDFKRLIDKLDLKKTFIAGHSFGGATVLEVLGQDQRFFSGIILDPWMLPMVSEAKDLSLKIQKHILFIMNEQFQTEKNMNYIKLFQNEINKFYTIKKSIHLNHGDFPILLVQDLSIIQKIFDVHTSRFSAAVPLAISNSLFMKFMLELLGKESMILQNLETFLESEEKHILKGVYGTGKSMLDWTACNLPPPSHSL